MEGSSLVRNHQRRQRRRDRHVRWRSLRRVSDNATMCSPRRSHTDVNTARSRDINPLRPRQAATRISAHGGVAEWPRQRSAKQLTSAVYVLFRSPFALPMAEPWQRPQVRKEREHARAHSRAGDEKRPHALSAHRVRRRRRPGPEPVRTRDPSRSSPQGGDAPRRDGRRGDTRSGASGPKPHPPRGVGRVTRDPGTVAVAQHGARLRTDLAHTPATRAAPAAAVRHYARDARASVRATSR